MERLTTASILGLFLSTIIIFTSLFGQGKRTKVTATRGVVAAGEKQNESAKIHRAIKFEETFRDTSDWTVVNNDGSPGGTVGKFFARVDIEDPDGNFIDSVKAEADTLFWFSNFQNANGFLIDEWLISPQLPVVEDGDSIYFYGGAIDAGFDDSIQVWITASDPQGSPHGFDRNLGRFKMDGPVANWTPYKVAIPGDLAGSPVWLALRYYITNGGPNGSNSDNVWIDHIVMTSNTIVGIEDDETGLPLAFNLEQNYPNPFNPTTDIRFRIANFAFVSLEIYSITGQLVKTLVAENRGAGVHSVRWDATNDLGQKVVSGIYLYKLQAGSQVEVKKMVLMK